MLRMVPGRKMSQSPRPTMLRMVPGRKMSQSPAWLLALLLVFGLSAVAQGQMDRRTVPTPAYHAAFAEFYDGEYKVALERFKECCRASIKTPQSRWIDSICYETMCGECYYHMGLYHQALEHYTSAVNLYLQFPTWMVQVQFPALRGDPSARKTPPWATRRLQAPLGVYPTTMLIGQGQIDFTTQLQQGGVVQQANLFPIEPQEIVRTTTLAIRRRAQLLGPLAKHDSLFDSLIAVLARRPGPPNHWSEAWINLELGVALAAGGREGQAVNVLQHAAVANGEFTHPLSSIAHLELGRLAMNRGDYDTALQHFEEASYDAFYYPEAGVLEEAFRGGALIHLIAARKGMFPPLAAAVPWAKTTRLHQLQTSLLLMAAENYLVLGQSAAAVGALEEARLTINRRTMGEGRLGARHWFLTATALFQQKKTPEGDKALATAITFMRQGSLWLFHVAEVDNYYVSGGGGGAAARTALELYQHVLRDPLPGDWAGDPQECLAELVAPLAMPFEHWFEAALARKEIELAIEVADRARRHRFLSTLSLGGRLESLRWVLEGPAEMLSQPALLQRQDLLTRYPAYEQLRRQAAELHKGLAAIPLLPEDAAARKKQNELFGKLAAAARQQEVLLREMGVRREPAALVFPPLRPTADIQRSLPKGHALLIFFATSRAIHAFLLNNERYINWPLGTSPQNTARHVALLLKAMGNFQQNHELSLTDLAESKWKQACGDMLDGLLKGSRADFTTHFDELAVVPDGVLWYLPFEALQVKVQGRMQPLLARFRLRYAPTAALATAPPGWGHRRGNTAVVLGRLFPKQDEEVTRAAFEQLNAAIPGCIPLKGSLPAPASLFATLVDRLVVLDDMNQGGDTGPYGWSPLPLDRGKPGSTLAEWLLLPRGGPEELIMPGFHTGAEDSLKKVSRSAPGNELFLGLCGLMARGCRTILLSRWRSGGQTSFDLVREFVQELPHTAPTDAWQRAVQVVATARLNPEAEPRIKKPASDESPRASHPLFWAGYMLVDSGVPAEGDGGANPPPKVEANHRPALPPAKPEPAEKKPRKKPGARR
jgi:tetratricopeptide (TPR) repeat protein